MIDIEKIVNEIMEVAFRHDGRICGFERGQLLKILMDNFNDLKCDSCGGKAELKYTIPLCCECAG